MLLTVQRPIARRCASTSGSPAAMILACAVGDVVGHAQHRHVRDRRVEQPERRARIAVARLTDRAAVDQIRALRSSAAGCVRRAAAPSAASSPSQPEDRRHVRVAEQAQRPLRRPHGAPRVEVVEDVGVLVERRAVADLDEVVDERRTRRQRRQPVAIAPASALAVH